ncbi:hypothetical protein V6N13_025318 [Hibiscus sabdariffa]
MRLYFNYSAAPGFAYHVPTVVSEPLVRSEIGLNIFLMRYEKLNGINFLDWFRNLRIVLKQERKEYVIEEPVPDELAANATRADKDKFKKHMDDMVDFGCLMLATMNSELQKQHENMVAYEMIQNLKEIYEGQAL